jgi:hypothetical protein
MTDGKCGRNADGTFGVGNSGKPRGTRHKATQAVLGLLAGQAEALTQRAVEMALGGDSTALRLCLERLAPPRKDAPVSFQLPHMSTATDAVAASGAVLQAVCEGDLTPSEGAQVMGLIDSFRRTLEITEIEARVAALESHC